MIGIDGRSSIYTRSVVARRVFRCSSPSASKLKALVDQVTQRVLLFAQGDLLGRAERLAADAFGNLLDFTTGLEERSNLIVD